MALRKEQATDTQNQIRKDVTRYRYGQEAHLDDSLQRLGLSPTIEERPVLTAIRETSIGDRPSTLAITKPRSPFTNNKTAIALWVSRKIESHHSLVTPIDWKLIPLEELGRPRVDVVTTRW